MRLKEPQINTAKLELFKVTLNESFLRPGNVCFPLKMFS